MTKQVSPVFAIIVILVVVAIGVIWFMMQERAYQTEWRRESQALQRMRDLAISSGRARRGGARRAGRRSRGPTTRTAPGAGAETTGEESGGESPAPSEESPDTP